LTFAVVDIETNGGRPGAGGITEIAVRITDGSAVLESREWLIRPEMPVPQYITNLTGIDNEMLQHAPAFSEVAEDVINMLRGHVFIAHNAAFDHTHLKSAFASCGMPLKTRTLCTVRLARRCWPGLKSYSLGNLCASKGIAIQNRHRAGGDADATVILFHKLVETLGMDALLAGTTKKNKVSLPAGLDIQDIPETTGVYQFLNNAGKVLYVGKALNLRKRVLQHFYKGGGGQVLLQEVSAIKTIPCGNELMALITESAFIRQHWPPYNKADRFKAKPCSISCFSNQDGMPVLALTGQQGSNQSLLRFPTLAAARNALLQLLKTYAICKAYNHSSRAQCTQEDCYCHTTEDVKKNTHRERMSALLESLSQPPVQYVLKGPGRSPEEYSCVWVAQSRILAYGYLSRKELPRPEQLEQELVSLEDHPSLRAIVMAFTTQAQMHPASYQLMPYPIN
jgi:DNA polymerase-3 subunit epsilon